MLTEFSCPQIYQIYCTVSTAYCRYVILVYMTPSQPDPATTWWMSPSGSFNSNIFWCILTQLCHSVTTTCWIVNVFVFWYLSQIHLLTRKLCVWLCTIIWSFYCLMTLFRFGYYLIFNQKSRNYQITGNTTFLCNIVIFPHR